MIKEAILRGLTEFGRVALIATLPLIISGLEANSLDWRVIAIAGVIAVLKAIDRGVHEYGVLEEEKKSTAKKEFESKYITGLVRF
jgi:hypothetical protein